LAAARSNLFWAFIKLDLPLFVKQLYDQRHFLPVARQELTRRKIDESGVSKKKSLGVPSDAAYQISN
jgi:hypothetical protein